ncbi:MULTISPECIES: DUF4145 domain-containing protein [Providencia]|uniref:DUF4145 domain-containing protein n=1 Tax=Providencia TaxID=586 RepID=UPI0010BEDFE0|nr:MULTISPECIES: DUF4145 domain-containing protein [Providencia]MCX9108167.1 DUF4145 domain-containing protein [Providencia rettgeri]QIF66675.1 DUF4145 domain-containing protein [Providencia sp. 1709051003]
MTNYITPKFHSRAFTCPHCGIASNMPWSNHQTQLHNEDNLYLYTARCDSCRNSSIWAADNQDYNSIQNKMVYPDSTGIAKPSEDMPEGVKKDYLEAASIYQKSPRGAVALLRLSLQKLCIHLGGKGENINNDLAALAKDEIVSKKLIKSADIIRIVGNNAVHPGTISDDDFDDVSFKLFKLINMIVQQGITEPREVDETFSTMPENARKAAEDRDKHIK